jgi:hypothetical protein
MRDWGLEAGPEIMPYLEAELRLRKNLENQNDALYQENMRLKTILEQKNNEKR